MMRNMQGKDLKQKDSLERMKNDVTNCARCATVEELIKSKARVIDRLMTRSCAFLAGCHIF
jgi:hypothetical protein